MVSNYTFSSTSGGAPIRLPGITGEIDDGDYATLRGPTGDLLHLSEFVRTPTNDHADDTSEEGKLLACVRDDSVTYASTRDLEPPISRTISHETFMRSPEHLGSPLAPVTVAVHSNDVSVSLN